MNIRIATILVLMNLGSAMGQSWDTGNWITDSWLSPFYSSDQTNWIFHNEHDWLYIHESEGGVNFYDMFLGWCWTSESTYPFLYIRNFEKWFYYELGSVEPRWIFDLKELHWSTVYPYRPYELSELDVVPQPIYQPAPVYPPEYRRDGIEGEVLLQFIIGTDGVPYDIYVISSTHAQFSQSCLLTIPNWRFTAGYINGAPINVRVRIPIVFRIR